MEKNKLIKICVGVIILGFLIPAILLPMGNNSDNNKENDNNIMPDFILVAQGKNNVYINKTNYESTTQGREGNISFFKIKRSQPFSISDSNNFSKRYFNNYKYEKSKGDIWYYTDVHNNSLIVRSSGKVSLVNREKNIDYIKNGYSRNELLKLSYNFTSSIGRSLSDYKVEITKYNNLTKIVYDKESGNYTITKMGCRSQTIKFRQYINDLPVYGDFGYIQLEFGPNNEILNYFDWSLRYSKVINESCNVCNKVHVLYRLANESQIFGNSSIVVNNLQLTIYAKDDFFSAIEPKYRIDVKPKSGGTGMVEYISSHPFGDL